MSAVATAGARGYAHGQLGAPVPLAPAAHAQNQVAPAAPVETVPDVVEDRREDGNGNVVIRRYQRGRLLGKVRGRAGARPGARGIGGTPARAPARLTAPAHPHPPHGLLE